MDGTGIEGGSKEGRGGDAGGREGSEGGEGGGEADAGGEGTESRGRGGGGRGGGGGGGQEGGGGGEIFSGQGRFSKMSFLVSKVIRQVGVSLLRNSELKMQGIEGESSKEQSAGETTTLGSLSLSLSYDFTLSVQFLYCVLSLVLLPPNISR